MGKNSKKTKDKICHKGGNDKGNSVPCCTKLDKSVKRTTELDAIFNNFAKNDAFVISSQNFILLEKNRQQYKCSLCNFIVVIPKNLSELRYKVWTHCNNEIHKKKLPNYESIANHTNKIIQKLSEDVDENLKKEWDCFKIGPTYGFAMCTICQCAVSINKYRLKNHLQDKHHLKNKQFAPQPNYSGEENKINHKHVISFKGFMSKLPEELTEEKKYIEMGSVSGYVICSLCSRALIQTPFYVQRHLTDIWHLKNKNNPLYVYEYSQREQNSKKPLEKRPLTAVGFDVFVAILTSDDVIIKANSKFLYKQYSEELYSCVLCSSIFGGVNVTENIMSHFREVVHLQKASLLGKREVRRDGDIFPLFDVIPEEVYEDISFIEVSVEGKDELTCSICEISFSSDVVILIDHIQSKQHSRKKLGYNLEINLSTNNIGNEQISSESYIEELSKKFIVKDGSKFMCSICKSVIATQSDICTFSKIKKIIKSHIKTKNHLKGLSDYVDHKSSGAEINKNVLEKLLNEVPDLHSIDKSCFRLSKKQKGYVKCKACKITFEANINNLKGHIKKREHEEIIAQKISSQQDKDSVKQLSALQFRKARS